MRRIEFWEGSSGPTALLKTLAAAACLLVCVLALAGCAESSSSPSSEGGSQGNDPSSASGASGTYVLERAVEVDGRQGVAAEDGTYWVSGSTTLSRYDSDWNLVASNDSPFAEGYDLEVNHIGDIDVYKGEVYCGVEMFLDGEASNIQIAVYDGETLQLNRTFNFEPSSGQDECSGICVNPDDGSVAMCSWTETGRYLYRYDLKSGAYLGKVELDPAPQWIQGVAYHNGAYYITADDGDADFDEPDHMYRFTIPEGASKAEPALELTLDDVTRQGEIEGLSFDEDADELLVLYNRGARIVLGMPKGFYDGYDHEIHEVFIYDALPAGQ